ncbi:hypothetical protein MFIFM68171_06334 [Madurella fahalii]|uniref:2',3'-cyclic-nucleotide 3'-phosphodiesterase n=1 Tax=Madurella fahalii TaxID=1157608 RepID=A0ABQ0GEN3_9PEZI
MPGSSLWLLPPQSHPLHTALSTLISRTLPARFPREAASSASVSPHFFAPHVTLTSEVAPSRYGADPQAWLDGMVGRWRAAGAGGCGSGSGSGGGGGGGDDGGSDSPAVKVRFERVATQDVFFRRCFIGVGFEGVKGLAGCAREWGVSGVADEEGERRGEGRFGEETERWLDWWRREYGPHVSLMYGSVPITDEVLKEVTRVVREGGVKLPKDGPDGAEEGGGWDGWDGGVVWLVPTDKPIAEWKPIATREL